MVQLSGSQCVRYERHIELPEIGEVGQARLLSSSILIVGAGGLGTPASAYLAAGGVGRLGIIDDDVVRKSNLQRQFLYKESDENKLKTECLRNTLKETTPKADIECLNERLSEGNAEAIISRYDLVLDGSDNFETKYLINRVCFQLRKPVIYGAVLNFDGQVSVFKGYEQGQPCYKCLYPEVPEHLVPTCSESAVLGPVVGVIGSLQAVEAMKELLGLPTLAGSLFLYSALNFNIMKTKIEKRDNCPVCGL